MSRLFVCVFVALCLFVSSFAQAGEPKYKKVSADEVARIVSKVESPWYAGERGDSLTQPAPVRVAHQPFRGAIGPFNRAIFYTNRHESEIVVWVAANVEGQWNAWSPVVLEDADTVHAVFFDDVNGDGHAEAFVIHSTMHGNIHGARDIYSVAAIEWDTLTRRFEARDWFGEASGIETVAQARAYLKRRGTGKPEKSVAKTSTTPTATATPTVTTSAARKPRKDHYDWYMKLAKRADGWSIDSHQGSTSSAVEPTCLFVFYKARLLRTEQSTTELLDAYGAVAEREGYVLAEEGRDRGQPYRVYRRDADMIQIKIGHGRGNRVVKVGFHDRHCRG